jgi:hypothetical protein
MFNKKVLHYGSLGISELTPKEMMAINAGSWLSYAFGYIYGTLVKITEAYSSTEEGKAVQQALRDFK